MPAYPGTPAPRLVPSALVERDGYTAYQLQSGFHIGTHVDAPIHMVPGGKHIDDLPPDSFIGAGKLLDVRGRTIIDVDALLSVSIEPGDMLLLMTGHDRYFGSETYYREHPLVTEALAQALVEQHIKALGLDMPSPDIYPFGVHRILLECEILLLENLTNLETLLPVESFSIYAVPPKIHAEAAPVNVIALV